MDREHVKGAADKAKGTIKDVAARSPVTPNWRLKGKSTRQRVPPQCGWRCERRS